MFAIVRTGGKQYRVAAGDKIAVEKLSGEAGDKISLGDILLAGEVDKAADLNGLLVSAEIIAQERGEKVIVFKKRRRHNYRRKQGHRQSLTLLRILAVGKEENKPAPSKAEVAAAPKAEKAPVAVEAAPATEAAPAAEVAPKKGAAPKKTISNPSTVGKTDAQDKLQPSAEAETAAATKEA